MTALRLSHSSADLDAAATLIRAGKLVAFPTETVYGLGADALQAQAVADVFSAKKRPELNPLIIHVPDIAVARNLVAWNDHAEALACLFWPGPLTLVLPIGKDCGVASLATAGLDTLAVRIPAHPVALDLLDRVNRPLAAPSANPSGGISPTRAEHVRVGLGDRISAIIDGGHCSVGVESTVVGLVGEPVLLRAGGVDARDVEKALGRDLGKNRNSGRVSAPGMLPSHYAPRATVRINATEARPDEIMLGFGAVGGILNLSETGNLREAAANLFDCLHRLDARGCPIAVAPVPDLGLGHAINDRLRRAAAPREHTPPT